MIYFFRRKNKKSVQNRERKKNSFRNLQEVHSKEVFQAVQIILFYNQKLNLTGISMSEDQVTCSNCMKLIHENKYPTHYGYCKRNIRKCDRCSEFYDVNYLSEHEEEFHKKVKCEYCFVQFSEAQIFQHKNQCTKKTQFCSYCELKVPQKQFENHFQICAARTKTCQKCSKPIKNKNYEQHEESCEGDVESYSMKVDFSNYVQRNKNRRRSPDMREMEYDFSHKIPSKLKRGQERKSEDENDSISSSNFFHEQSFESSFSLEKMSQSVQSDAELQKVLMQSMREQHKPNNNAKIIPEMPEIEGVDLEEQLAILREIQKMKKK